MFSQRKWEAIIKAVLEAADYDFAADFNSERSDNPDEAELMLEGLISAAKFTAFNFKEPE